MEKTNSNLKFYGTKTIMTIDDDNDILDNIREVFEMEGYKVISANNGRAALDLLGKLPDDQLPHLIFLDYMMPILNGDGFNAEKLKIPRLSAIPVVLMTANGNIHSIMHDLDAEAYVNKPMDIDHLLKIALNFIHRRDSAKTSFLA